MATSIGTNTKPQMISMTIASSSWILSTHPLRFIITKKPILKQTSMMTSQVRKFHPNCHKEIKVVSNHHSLTLFPFHRSMFLISGESIPSVLGLSQKVKKQ